MALSEIALGFAQNTRYRGPIQAASHFGESDPPGGGPYFQLWLVVQDGTVRQASYETHGCPSSMAVGGGLCRLIQGRRFDLVQTLTREDIVAFVGPLPEGKE